MSSPVSFLAVVHCLRTLSLVAVDLIRLVALATRPRAALVAENLFLRKQLALFQERQVRPRRADAATRWMLAALSQWFAWRNALVNVQADTLLRWYLVMPISWKGTLQQYVGRLHRLHDGKKSSRCTTTSMRTS